MKWFSRLIGLLVVGVFLWGCETPQFQTLMIFDGPNRVVALQVMPDAYGGKGYDHPVTMTEAEMVNILRGLRVEEGLFGSPDSSQNEGHPVFSEGEGNFFAPLFVKGLSQATREELVTFFETAELSPEYQGTTSGGLFVTGDALHVILSNYLVKSRIWRDNEQYQASYRNRPLEPMEFKPGRLVYEPRESMVLSLKGEMGRLLTGKPWQVAVRLQDVSGSHSHSSRNHSSKAIKRTDPPVVESLEGLPRGTRGGVTLRP